MKDREADFSIPAGGKNDTGKARWDLLPLGLIEDAVRVLTHGAVKYGEHNWKSVENGKERYYAALMRHIAAYRRGELADPDTKLSHLAHAICNLIFLYEFEADALE